MGSFIAETRTRSLTRERVGDDNTVQTRNLVISGRRNVQSVSILFMVFYNQLHIQTARKHYFDWRVGALHSHVLRSVVCSWDSHESGCYRS